MKNLKAKAVCVMLSASMAAMGLTGCGSDNVDGTKTAITVNDESITLGQANFMLTMERLPGKRSRSSLLIRLKKSF